MEKYKNILKEESHCVSAEQMQAYLAQELDAKEKHAFEKQLLDCPLSAEAVEGMQEYGEAIDIVAVSQALNAQIRNKTGSKTVAMRWQSMLAVAASLVLLFVATWTIFDNATFLGQENMAMEKTMSQDEGGTSDDTGFSEKNDLQTAGLSKEEEAKGDLELTDNEEVKGQDKQERLENTRETKSIVRTEAKKEEQVVGFTQETTLKTEVQTTTTAENKDKSTLPQVADTSGAGDTLELLAERNQSKEDEFSGIDLEDTDEEAEGEEVVAFSDEILDDAVVEEEKVNARRAGGGLAKEKKKTTETANEKLLQLSQQLEQDPKNLNYRYQYGALFFDSKKLDQANEQFTYVLADSSAAFFEEAQWKQALIFIQKKKKKKAIKLLKTIETQKGKYSQEAVEKRKVLEQKK